MLNGRIILELEDIDRKLFERQLIRIKEAFENQQVYFSANSLAILAFQNYIKIRIRGRVVLCLFGIGYTVV